VDDLLPPPLPFAPRPAPYGRVSGRMVQLLRESRSWVRFLSILLSVVGILEACGGLAMALQPMPLRLIGILFLVFGGASLAFSTPLHRLAVAIDEVEHGDRDEAFERALENQRVFFKLAGIITASSLVLMLPAQIAQILTLFEERRGPEPATGAAAVQGPALGGRRFGAEDLPRLCGGATTFVCLPNRGGELVEEGTRRVIREGGHNRFKYGAELDGSVWLSVSASPTAMSFRFVAPNGATLEPGLYPIPPTITEDGQPFGGCPQPGGTFRVLHIERDFLGSLQELVTDFDVLCDGAHLVGRVSIRRERE
jgi:hypothetical protein